MNRNNVLVALNFFCFPALISVMLYAEPVYTLDFENMENGEKWKNNNDLIVDGNGGVNETQGLRVRYRILRSSSGRGSPVNNYRIPIPPANEYTLNYDIFFEDNWTFALGGKFHGLCPINPSSGCVAIEPDGWSSRVTIKGDRKPSLYLYDQKRTSGCGRQITGASVRFEKERWYSISLHTKINSTALQSDGYVELFVNGVPQMKKESVQWFSAGTLRETMINNFYFNTFLGGNRTGTLEQTEYVRFDNFEIHPGRVIRNKPGPTGLKMTSKSLLGEGVEFQFANGGIDVRASAYPALLKIINLRGKAVFVQRLMGEKFLPVPQLNGVYVIHFATKEFNHIQKIGLVR